MKQEKKIKNYFFENEFDIDGVITDYNGFLQKLVNNMKLFEFTAEEKQELIVNCFYIIMNNYSNFDQEKTMSGYIASIIQCLVNEKESVKSERAENALLEENIAMQPIGDIDMLVEDRNYLGKVKEAIDISKELDKEIFILKYLNGMSYKEISKEVSFSENEIKRRFSRLNKKIRRELSKGESK